MKADDIIVGGNYVKRGDKRVVVHVYKFDGASVYYYIEGDLVAREAPVSIFTERYEPVKPKCEIINGDFNWILKVDGMTIPFNGRSCAEYFERLYKKFGYDVIVKDQ